MFQVGDAALNAAFAHQTRHLRIKRGICASNAAFAHQTRHLRIFIQTSDTIDVL
jgi:hypothetical protein